MSYASADEGRAGKLGPDQGGYHDIDACPTLSFLISKRNDAMLGRYLQWSVAKRPARELFDIRKDPSCLNNLAAKAEFASVVKDLDDQLTKTLKATGDARIVADDGGDVWETYPRYSRLRWFPEPEWARKNPKLVPHQPWLEKRRP